MSKKRKIRCTHNRLGRESFADDASYMAYIEEQDRLEDELENKCMGVGGVGRMWECEAIKLKKEIMKVEEEIRKKEEENKKLSEQLRQEKDKLKNLSSFFRGRHG